MKKLLLLLLLILFLIGCENIQNTPTNKVQSFLESYQKMDSSVLQELDYILEKDQKLSKSQKKDYKELLERQYQNLSYKITKEEIEDNHAIVDVKVEVFHYKKILDNDEDSINQKIQLMRETQERIQYECSFFLEKKEGIWRLEEISDDTRQKIHGIY